MSHNKNLKTARVIISGMTCKSCEILIERKWKNIDGMVRVDVDHARGYADLVYTKTPDVSALRERLGDARYTITPWDGKKSSLPRPIHSYRNYVEAGGIMLILLALYLVAQKFEIIPRISVTEGMSYGFVFLIGIVAAVSTCIAVAGGLLLAATAQYAQNHPNAGRWQSFKPIVYFNAGRLISYALFGGVIGLIGSVLAPSHILTGLITIVASIVMVMIGFRLLHIFPIFDRLIPRPPKALSHFLHDVGQRYPKAGPFLLGASTFFLPCGFTQSLQFYVLSQGNPITGALTMVVFALGTLPSLLSLGALSSFTTGKVRTTFLKYAGSLLVLIGLLTIQGGFALAGVSLDIPDQLTRRTSASARSTLPAARIEGNIQVMDMRVDGLSYSVPKFTVRQNIPLQWRIDGRAASGCAQIFTVPQMGITQMLSADDITTVSFVPTRTGTFAFHCPMGMTTLGSFTVIPNL